MSEDINIGTFKLKIDALGRKQILHGSVFLDKENGDYKAQIDNGSGKYLAARRLEDAVVLAISEFVDNHK